MIRIKLIREVYNQNGVFGTIHIKDTELQKDLVIKTVERPQLPKGWEKLTPTQRMMYCVPTGQYPMKWKFDVDLEIRFIIRGVSTWRTMLFSSSNLSTTNVIKVGFEATSDGIIKGGVQVLKELSDYIKELMRFGIIPITPQYGFFILEIENSPTYHEEGIEEEYVQNFCDD